MLCVITSITVRNRFFFFRVIKRDTGLCTLDLVSNSSTPCIDWHTIQAAFGQSGLGRGMADCSPENAERLTIGMM